jgi:hypothetical protein
MVTKKKENGSVAIIIAKVVSLLANLRFPNENEEQTFVKGNPRKTPTN